MRYFIYIHTCPNGKRYIGITTRKPDYRWNSGNGYKYQPHFFNAIQKYGWDNIDHMIFETTSELTMFFWEKVLIHHYKTNDKRYGYNCSDGGESGSKGYKFTNEQKKRISQKKKGHKVSTATRLKISNKKKGHTTSEETKKKISESLKGRVSPRKGVKLSEDTKMKISLGCKGKISEAKKNKKKLNEQQG